MAEPIKKSTDHSAVADESAEGRRAANNDGFVNGRHNEGEPSHGAAGEGESDEDGGEDESDEDEGEDESDEDGGEGESDEDEGEDESDEDGGEDESDEDGGEDESDEDEVFVPSSVDKKISQRQRLLAKLEREAPSHDRIKYVLSVLAPAALAIEAFNHEYVFQYFSSFNILALLMVCRISSASWGPLDV